MNIKFVDSLIINDLIKYNMQVYFKTTGNDYDNVLIVRKDEIIVYDGTVNKQRMFHGYGK